LISIQTNIGPRMRRDHCALITAEEFSFSQTLDESRLLFSRDWDDLELDPYMADGGKYRYRRYGLFELTVPTARLVHRREVSFFQSTETNPLNGGIDRHFAQLGAATISSAFLRALVHFDFAQFTADTLVGDRWLVGVHQIRILATAGVFVEPTPESTHRDDETFTAQHLIARHNIVGGINSFYGRGGSPTQPAEATWEQQSYFDSYYFDRSVWHDVSSVTSGALEGDGHRDILLIDYVESPAAAA